MPAPPPERASYRLQVRAAKGAILRRTLRAAHGNKSEAARRLGVRRENLHKLLRAYL